MRLFEYLKLINKKVEEIHNHPNLKPKYRTSSTTTSSNPFESGLNHTYVWLENDTEENTS